MMDREKIKKLLVQFFESKVGYTIDEKTEFFDDLGVDGLDVDVLIQDLEDQFSIDFSTFETKKYYNQENEVGNIFRTLKKVIFNRKSLVKETFGLEHLLSVIEQKKWFDPVNPH